jgi:periplasmic mercuric ion binding protein
MYGDLSSEEKFMRESGTFYTKLKAPMKNIAGKFLLLSSLVCFATGLFAQTAEVKIKTSAVCEMCKKTIERDLAFEKGVKKVTLNLDDKVVRVVYNPKKTDEQKIRFAITQIGYDADSLAADSLAYQKLPACCKKDSEMH